MAVSWVGLLPGSERDRLINFTRLSYSGGFCVSTPRNDAAYICMIKKKKKILTIMYKYI